MFSVDPIGSRDFGACDCCGKTSRRVWGSLFRDGSHEAVFYITWIVGGAREHGATFRLILGRWGGGAAREDRVSVVLELRWNERGPQFMVRDSHVSPGSPDALVARHLRREDVVGTPLADRVFALVDAIWANEPRIAEVTQG